jgi:hypothetical protein
VNPNAYTAVEGPAELMCSVMAKMGTCTILNMAGKVQWWVNPYDLWRFGYGA